MTGLAARLTGHRWGGNAATRMRRSAVLRALAAANLFWLLVLVMADLELAITVAVALPARFGWPLAAACLIAAVAAVLGRRWARDMATAADGREVA